MSTLSSHTRRSLVGALLCSLAAIGHAQDSFPNQPIKLVVPFPAGGTTDILARILAPRLGEKLKQPVLVENKAGAATLIGTMAVVKAPADGYTLLLTGPSTFTTNPAVNQQMQYDPLKSFDLIGLAGTMPVILLASSNAPFHSVKELVAAAKQEPGRYFYGSFGSGSIVHFAGETLNSKAGIKLAPVAYKGSAPAMADLIGQQIPLSFDTVVAAVQHVRGGKVRALAVTSAQRSALLPDVPTLAEAGYPGIDISSWLGVAAPAGLPPAVRKRLETVLQEVLADKATQDSLLALGIEPVSSKPEEFSRKVTKELAAFRQIAVDAGIKPE
ncbi:tripartite tricarboxylate transporter substrate binding protein [Xylophilus sp. GW821-FHT01B05]